MNFYLILRKIVMFCAARDMNLLTHKVPHVKYKFKFRMQNILNDIFD